MAIGRGVARRSGRIASWAAIAVVVALALIVLVPSLLGMRRYVIVSGSMTGTYDRGSLVFDEVVPTGDLGVGDVITYRPPPAAHVDHVITHRIAAIAHAGRGERLYRTKGDANQTADPWRFMLTDAHQARTLEPAAGRLRVRRPADPHLRLYLLGAPAILIGFASLVALWRRLGEESARRATSGPAAA